MLPGLISGWIQEMLGYPLGGLLQTFGEWTDGAVFPTDTHESMEQLWLAFVMVTIYKKKWSGKEWKIEW